MRQKGLSSFVLRRDVYCVPVFWVVFLVFFVCCFGFFWVFGFFFLLGVFGFFFFRGVFRFFFCFFGFLLCWCFGFFFCFSFFFFFCFFFWLFGFFFLGGLGFFLGLGWVCYFACSPFPSASSASVYPERPVWLGDPLPGGNQLPFLFSGLSIGEPPQFFFFSVFEEALDP